MVCVDDNEERQPSPLLSFNNGIPLINDFLRWKCELKGAHWQNIFYFNYWANRSTIILYGDCASAWELVEVSKTHKLFSILSCKFKFKGVFTSWLFTSSMYIDHKIVEEFFNATLYTKEDQIEVHIYLELAVFLSLVRYFVCSNH